MDNQLLKYQDGSTVVPLRDRRVAKEAKKVFDEVRLASLKSEGSTALAGRIMQQVVELDAYRRDLTQGDPALDAMLMDIELTALRQAKNVQANLFNGWGL